jgi:uncharacterized protein YgbK (DUF1537 family)
LLGAIADDATGAVDLASNLVSRGFRTRLRLGAPTDQPAAANGGDCDALVVGLKSRTAPLAQALASTGAALDWLVAAGARRVYVKYCSTFDSTPRGNIGPVCDLVVERLGAGPAVVAVSFPDNGRTVYQGHLFVEDRLLSDSSMARHPLTPMTDSNLVRVLGRQTGAGVALVPLTVVRRGAEAVAQAIRDIGARGLRYAVVDAIDNADLAVIAQATAQDTVVTGASGLALGLTGPRAQAAHAPPDSVRPGPRVVLAGSASSVTKAQLARAGEAGVPIFRLDPDAIRSSAAQAFERARQRFADAPGSVAIIAPARSDDPVDATSPGGAERAAALESALGGLARRFVALGARRIIVAGGETSGAVAQALAVAELSLGRIISPGVAWAFGQATVEGRATPVALALKSGNFGPESMFVDAWSLD